jgi:hypothetical protein
MALTAWMMGLAAGWAAMLLVAPAAAQAPAPASRPVLEQYQGRYFRWTAPRGWSMNETTNGVDLVAPDGRTLVSSALLVGGFGQMTPRTFLAATLRQVNPSAQIVGARRLPNQPGIPGPWIVEDFAITATAQGVPVRAQATVGVSEAYGRYSATVMLYQASAASWPQARLWLPAVAQSIVVTNPRQVAGQDRVMLPRNNPLDNSGLIESWRRKGLSEDRISQGRREGTMGYTRMEDPQTGRRYNVPLEAYDGTVGGYRNPLRPNELLRKLPPGE